MTKPREIEALALRIGSAAADWNRYLNSTRGYDPMAPVQSVTDALDTADTALRALVAENGKLEAEVNGVWPPRGVAIIPADQLTPEQCERTVAFYTQRLVRDKPGRYEVLVGNRDGDVQLSDAINALVAQLAAAQTENTRLRAALAQSKDPCVYCQLPAEKMARCRSGFLGCARADDMAGCPEFGASMEVHSLREQLAAARAVLWAIADYGWADDGKVTFTVNVGSREDARALAAQLDATIDAAKGVRDAKS